MGSVYEAEHVELSRHVALKLMHPQYDAGEQARRRFEEEARAAAATGHENVIDVFDLGRDDRGAPYLVMELLSGVDLGRAIHQVGRLSPRRSAWIAGQVLLALEAVHRIGIRHRDLKPDNVFLTRRAGISDWVKVLDFGVAEFAEAGAAHKGRRRVAAGTLHYMAPEQARGDAGQDERVDLYAVGALLYECLTGELPFEGADARSLRRAVVAGAFTPLDQLEPSVDPELAGLVHRAMATAPQLRPESARAFFDALRPFGAGSPPDPVSLTPGFGVSRQVFSSGVARAPNQTAPTRDATRSSRSNDSAGAPSGSRSAPPDAERQISEPRRAAPARAAFAPRPRGLEESPRPFHRGSVESGQSAHRAGAVAPASGRQPTPASTTAPLRVRGYWVSALVDGLAVGPGGAQRREVLARLPAWARATFEGVLLPTSWTDARVVDALIEAADAVPRARRLGREAVQTRHLERLRRSYHRPSDGPDWLAPSSELIDGGHLSSVPAEDAQRVVLRADEHPGTGCAAALAGLLEGLALEHGGVKVLRISHRHEDAHGEVASLVFRAP